MRALAVSLFLFACGKSNTTTSAGGGPDAMASSVTEAAFPHLAAVDASSRPSPAPVPVQEILDVSIIALLARPEEFRGKRVRVDGYVAIEFEGDAVYLHKEDFENMLTANALWLDIRRSSDAGALKPGPRGYCFVEATFEPDRRGHMGMFGGALTEITRLEPSHGAALRRSYK